MRYQRIHLWCVLFAAGLFAVGLVVGEPATLIPGLKTILLSQSVLITDYIAIAGPAAAFANAALVTLASVFVLWITKDPPNGFTMVEIGLMAGFALFGKNILNIWPILLGSFLYAAARREPLHKYAGVALLATCLSPAVSFFALAEGWGSPLAGLLAGLGIGFIAAPLSAYTYRIQNGMNLYNMGFACGLIAIILVPLMNALGNSPSPVLHWAAGYNLPFAILLCGFCLVLIVCGLFFSGLPVWAVWAGYRKLLQTTGRAPSDYLRMLGDGALLVNMGVNGLIGTAYILCIGGDLNGPTIGGIFAIMGFSAFGKHARNILPIMLGVVAGSWLTHWSLDDPAVQIAGLFCTTLAPISGHFGWPYGILAGFLHASAVLRAGTAAEGMNLYNNGFTGGLIAIVLYAVLTNLVRHRDPTIVSADDYFDVFDSDRPLSPDSAERQSEKLD